MAPPILRLCDLYLSPWNPAKDISRDRFLEKNCLGIGLRVGNANKGPGLNPRSCKYSVRCLTGQICEMDCWGIGISTGLSFLLCLKCVILIETNEGWKVS